jgi:hypothetical protein
MAEQKTAHKPAQTLPQPFHAAASVLQKVPGAGMVGKAAEGALDRIGAVSPRGRRVAVYTGAGVLGVAGLVEWPVALAGAAVAWLTQPRPDRSAGAEAARTVEGESEPAGKAPGEDGSGGDGAAPRESGTSATGTTEAARNAAGGEAAKSAARRTARTTAAATARSTATAGGAAKKAAKSTAKSTAGKTAAKTTGSAAKRTSGPKATGRSGGSTPTRRTSGTTRKTSASAGRSTSGTSSRTRKAG